MFPTEHYFLGGVTGAHEMLPLILLSRCRAQSVLINVLLAAVEGNSRLAFLVCHDPHSDVYIEERKRLVSLLPRSYLCFFQ